MFSARLPPSLHRNRLSSLLDELRGAGEPVLDLTASNPVDVDLCHDGEALASALAQASVAGYRPLPSGLACAREAVSSAIGQRYAPGDLLLTASTSEAYGYLFKLLCQPGDAVLVPRPSYPLFEHLTGLEGVELRPYRLHYAGGWQLDLAEIEAALGPRVRAVLAVNPNNPTGNYLAASELAGLSELCETRAALIVDEVFYEYPLRPSVKGPAAAVLDRGLVFGLGGLSKLAGLPQLKLAWIGVGGAPELRREALARLELIADAYLSVGAPVQLAAAELLRLGAVWRSQALERVRLNRSLLEQTLCTQAPECTVLAAEGGWTAVVRLPAVEGEEQLVERLLREQRLLVHPGYFYDFEREAFIVLSLLVEPPLLQRGLVRLVLGLTGGV